MAVTERTDHPETAEDRRHRRGRPARPHALRGRQRPRGRHGGARGTARTMPRRRWPATSRSAAPSDAAALTGLAERCDVVTFDHELVDLEALAALEVSGVVVRPVATGARRRDRQGPPAAHVRRRGAARPQVLRPRRRRGCRPRRAPRARRRARPGPGRQGRARRLRRPRRGRRRSRSRTRSTPSGRGASGRRRGRRGAVRVPRRAGRPASRGGPAARRVQWRAVETDQVDGVCREVRVPGGVDDATARRAAELAAPRRRAPRGRRRARRRAVRHRRRPRRERGGHPAAQLGPLDDRGRDHLAVREPPARRARPPARRHRRRSRPPSAR